MNRRGKIVSYLLNDGVDSGERLSISMEIEHRFPCTGFFSIIPHITQSLEKNGSTPSLNHFKDEYGYNHIDELNENVVKQADVLDLVEKEYKQLLQNRVISQLSDVVDQPNENVNDLIVSIRSIVDKYDKKLDIHKKRLTAKELYQERVKNYSGLKSFIEPIDDCVPLFETGEMSCIAGAPGHFKTTLALNMMYKNVVERDKDCVFLSLEMKREDIYNRILCKHSYNQKFNRHVSLTKLKKAELTKEETRFLFDVVEEDLLENYGSFAVLDFYDISSFTISGLRSVISRQEFSPDGVFIDYAQILRNEPLPIQNYQSNPINYFVRQFNLLKDDVDGTGKKSHVCLLSQVNRNAQRKAVESGGRYDVDSLSESNALDRNTNQIWSIYAPNVLKEQDEARVFMIKNRSEKDHDTPKKIKISDFFEEINVDEEGEIHEGRDFDLDEALQRLAEGGEF